MYFVKNIIFKLKNMNTNFISKFVGLKFTAFLLLCGTMVLQSKAQRIDVFGGINMTGIPHKIGGERQDGSGNFGLHAGMALFLPFNAKKYNEADGGEGYGLLPILQIVKKGTSKSSVIRNYAADIKVNFLQLNLPLTYHAGLFEMGIGPYAAYGLSGTKKFRVGNGEKEKIDFGKELKTMDYGLGFHFSYLLFKFQYDLGLANLSTENNNTAKTRNFSLSLNIPLFNTAN